MNRNINPVEDLSNAANRLIGKGLCVDCHKYSGKYKRCFKCNKSNQKYFNEKKHRQEEYEKKMRLFMITRGKECKRNGGKQCNIICPNCSPMEKWDENLQTMVKETLDYLIKEQDEEDLKELEMLEKELEQAIK
jgi:trimethylamine:corrinoid methyltransferase-like protein